MNISRSKTFLPAGRAWVGRHKWWSAILVVAVLGGGWYAYAAMTSTTGETSYSTSTVATGTVVAILSESGQISATSDISVVSQASGAVQAIYVKPGTHVRAGTAIAQIDPTDAQKALRSAQEALQSAQISLDKLRQPASTSTITASENSVTSAQAALVKAHEDGYNDVSSTFLDLPSDISGLDTVLHGHVVTGRTYEQNENAYADLIQSDEPTVTSYVTAAETSYQKAYTSYQAALAAFNATPRNASDATIEALIKQSYLATADLSDALKASTNFLSFVNSTMTKRQTSVPSSLATHLATLSTYTNQVNNHASALSVDASTITSDVRALAAAQASLADIQSGTDALDLQASQLSVQQKQEALDDANTDLADTVVRAPFSGTLASIAVDQYQTIGTGATIATMVSDNLVATLSVSEADAIQIKPGQKATLTFDALPDATIAGTVASISAAGSVSSGVVSYTVDVSLDTSNGSVKPGMSVTADIITGSASGLVVPASAVKTSGSESYVLVFDPPLAEATTGGTATTRTPTRAIVTTGLVGDTQTIIKSGVSAGEQVVTKSATVSSKPSSGSATKATTSGGRAGGPSGGVIGF